MVRHIGAVGAVGLQLRLELQGELGALGGVQRSAQILWPCSVVVGQGQIEVQHLKDVGSDYVPPLGGGAPMGVLQGGRVGGGGEGRLHIFLTIV